MGELLVNNIPVTLMYVCSVLSIRSDFIAFLGIQPVPLNLE